MTTRRGEASFEIGPPAAEGIVTAGIGTARFIRPDFVTLFQRILLITDGTVTHLLETFAGEPIRVVKLRQSLEEAGDDLPELELGEREKVLHREVLLRGGVTGQTLLYATSEIVPHRLPTDVRRGLLESNKPIGHLLEEGRIETFREIMDARCEPAESCGPYFGLPSDGEVISRTYRVLAGGQPIMRITEKFPADAFLLDGLGSREVQGRATRQTAEDVRARS